MTETGIVRKGVFLVVSTLEGSAEEPVVGPGRVMTDFARELQKRHGCDVRLISTFGPQDSPLTRQLEEEGLFVEQLGMASMWDPRGVSRFRRLLHRHRPSIVHSRTVRADLLARLGKSYGAKVVNNIVSLFPQDAIKWHGALKGRAVMAFARATSRFVDVWVPNARALVPSVGDVFGAHPEAVEVIRDGIPLDPWTSAKPLDRRSLSIPEGALLCFSAARLHPQKGVDILVEAFGHAASRRDDLYLLIAGEGSLRSTLERTIAARGLTDRVQLMGFREDIPALMATADLFVLPSRMEGLPTSIMEAMAAGLPVLATDVGGTSELVQEGRTGWLVPSEDRDALATALEKVHLPDLKETSQNAAAQARSFSIEGAADGFAALYAKITDDERDSGRSRSLGRGRFLGPRDN